MRKIRVEIILSEEEARRFLTAEGHTIATIYDVHGNPTRDVKPLDKFLERELRNRLGSLLRKKVAEILRKADKR